MTALVTGAGGFLGAALVDRLCADGDRDLRALVRPGSRRDGLDAVERRHGVRLDRCLGTLTAPADCARAVAGVEVVYHLAASLAGGPADIFLHTVVATRHLLDAMVALPRPPKLVLVSSFGVYGVAALGRGAVVDESTPLEPEPARRDVYSQAKLRQEQLVREYQARHGFPLVVLRPGVIYGPRGSALSARVGLALGPLFLALGGRNRLPLTYVDNCAEAISLAGRDPRAAGRTFNVVDDDLPTCREYLRAYQRQVRRLRVVPIPYPAFRLLAAGLERYSRWSQGQLPAVFSPYKAATTWGGNRFRNDALKSLGWQPRVSTRDGMARTFAALREQSA